MGRDESSTEGIEEGTVSEGIGAEVTANKVGTTTETTGVQSTEGAPFASRDQPKTWTIDEMIQPHVY